VGRVATGRVAVLLAMLWWAPGLPTGLAMAQLVISEFRLRGPNGANDEFVELYNMGPAPHTVASSDGSPGYALAASGGSIRFVIPNGIVIPPHEHFLGVNTMGYSIGNYPAGVSSTATGDAIFTADIPDNAGIALFSTSNPANFSLATRLDAVGSTAEANTLYKEGTGYPMLTPFSIDCAWYRDMKTGNAKNTNDNAADFLFVDTNGTSAGGGQRLGAPGPENSTSPSGDSGLTVSLLDPTQSATAAPNFVRDFTSNPAQNETFGSVTIRRTITNSTTVPITRLRFRISELTTFPSPSSISDLRPNTSSSTSVSVNGVTVNVLGTTLEQPPSQPNGGGFNSTMSAALPAPVQPGASVSVQFRFGIQQTGQMRVCGNLESLPGAGAALGQVGNTDVGASGAPCTRVQAFPPYNITRPSITPTGSPTAGDVLTVGLGTWTDPGGVVYTVQWRRCDSGGCTDIAGAVNQAYTVTLEDVGKTLRARVTATNGGGVVTVETDATGAVEDTEAPALTASTDGGVKKGVVSALLACPASEITCSGTVRFTVAIGRKHSTELELGSASFSLAGNASTMVSVTLSKKGKSLVNRKRRMAVMMIVDVVDAAGNPATVAQSVTLRKQRR